MMIYKRTLKHRLPANKRALAFECRCKRRLGN